MRLVVTTPLALVLDASDAARVQAEDTSGGFGILPGHADFLTVLPVSVLTWFDTHGAEHNVALRRAVLRVSGGQTVSVAAREAVAADALADLKGAVLDRFRTAERDETAVRISTERLHLATMRSLQHYLGSASGYGRAPSPDDGGPT